MNSIEKRYEQLKDHLELDSWTCLAKAFGVSRQTLHNWKANNRAPDAKSLLKARDSIGLNVDWLIRGGNRPITANKAQEDPYLSAIKEILPFLSQEQKERLLSSASDYACANSVQKTGSCP